MTLLLRDWRSGDRAALDELMPLIYGELHKLAASYLRSERPGHTLRSTDLISEAYLRLLGGAPPELSDRTHFFGIAARTMRQILVDHARKRSAGKRGAGERPITLDDQVALASRPDQLVALDAALEAFEAVDERKARVVELHYFGGMTQEEIATLLAIHINTVARDLRLAEAWLNRRLREDT